MKPLLIGAASAAVLALAGPAAAQYPPPPPPPPADADQYGPAQDQADQADRDVRAPDEADQPDDADQGPPDQAQPYDQGQPDDQDMDEQDDDQDAGPPPPGGEPGYGPPPPGQDYGRQHHAYAPPPTGQYGREPGASGYGAGPDYEPGEDLVAREDRLEQRIGRLAERGRLDPRAADAAMAELRSIQDEQDGMMRSGQGLSEADHDRLSDRLDQLRDRLGDMRRGGA